MHMKKYTSYQCPNIDFIEVCTEGVFCSSPLENLGENPGFWAGTESVATVATIELPTVDVAF